MPTSYMVKLRLNVGREYDGYGEQVVKKEVICLTEGEASYYLTTLIEDKGVEFTKQWLNLAKGKQNDRSTKDI